MSTTIESLELEIQSKSTSATNSIDALASSLNKLKNAVKGGVGLTSVIKQLTTLKTSLGSISSGNTENFNKFVQGLKTLSDCGNFKLSSSIATQIINIGNAIQSLNDKNFTSLYSLANALTPLVGIGKANLNSFIFQLQRLPQAVQALDSVDLGSLSQQINLLVKSFTPLSQMGKNNLTSFVTQLLKIPQLMQSLRSVDIGTLTAQIQQLANAFAPLAMQMQKISTGFASFPNRIQRLIQTTNNLSGANNKAIASYTNLAAKIAIAATAVRSAARVIATWITASNKYVENMNLFTVSMGKYAEQAQQYAEHVADIMGIDPGEWMRNQGIFMTLASGFGVASDRAYVMSQNLTQLGYDLSSFFNISFEDSMQKLQSGIAGELEPLRRLGYDLSIARLQQEAYTLGITKKVNAMTQAEKAELRYYAIMTQVTTAQGDMARTLEAPANQLRILQAQVTQCARALGNIFIPVLNAVLPYAIAVSKVIRMVADVIAGLFGFSFPEIDYSGIDTAVGNVADSTGDVADSLNDATKKAKEFKTALLGIDELNIISPPDDSSEEDSKDNGGGLGFELPTYNFIDSAVNSKVQEIVDKMKEWLGITGEINSWADLFNTNLGKILIVVGLIGGAFLLWKLSKPFVTGLNALRSLFGGGKSGSKTSAFSVPSPKTVLKGLADIGLIIGGLVVVVEAIGLLMQIPGFEQIARDGIKAVKIVFEGLGSIIIPLTAFSLGVIGLGKIGVATVAKGLAGISVIIGGISALVTAIGALISIPYFSDFLATGIKSVISVFEGLWAVALPIGTLSGTLIALGIASPALILSGLAGFALVIGGIELVLVALGALKQIPGFSWIVGEGGKVLIQLGEILGSFAGSIINSFLVEISNAFPDIGQNLSDFMINARPFFAGLETVNVEAVNAIKRLAEIVLILTAMDILNGLTAWFTGGNSLTKFGKDLYIFAPYFAEYSNKIKGVDGEAVQASAIAAKSLAEFANNIPNSGGVAGFFAGENDIDVWGAKLPSFGKNFKAYSDSIKGVDGEAVQASATAAQSIVAFASNIPNEGGIVSWFEGDNTLDVWGAKLPSFGKNFKAYSDSIKGVDGEAVQASATAAQSIVAFASNIPNEGGIVSWFEGDNTLDVWGAKLPSFGKNFKAYSDSIKGVDGEAVQASATAAQSIVAFASNIPNEGGIVSWFEGDNTLDVWGAKLPSFGKNFKAYSDSIKGVDGEAVQASATAAQSIVAFASNIPNEGGIVSWFEGDNTLDVWGAKLPSFGKNFKAYSDSIKGVDGEAVQASATAAQSIVAFASNIPNEGGIVSWFEGDNTLDVWGAKLPSFGKNFKAYSDSIKGVDGEAVQASATAAQSIVAFASNIPNEGGIVSWFEGDNTLDVWGAKLPSFGKNFKAYSDSIKGVDGEAVQASATAAQSIVAFANNIPNEGGIVSWFEGDNTLDVWGAKLPSFGKNFKAYSDSIKGVDGEAVQASSAAAQSIVAFANNIPNEDGIVSWFAGDNKLDVWGAKLPGFGKNFKAYSDSMKGVDGKAVQASSAAAQSIVAFASNIPNEGGIGSWFSGEKNIVSFGEKLALFGAKFKTYYDYIRGINSNKVSQVNSEINKILDWSVKVASTDTQAIESFGSSLKKLGEDFSSCAGNIIIGFTEKISSAYTTSKDSVVSWATSVKNWFTNGGVNSQTFSTYAQNIITGFKNKMGSRYTDTRSSMTAWATSVKNWFTNGGVNSQTFSTYAQNIITGFKNKMGSRYTDTRSSMTAWATSVKNWFTNGGVNSQTFSTYAQNIITGFKNKMGSRYTDTRSSMTAWATSVKNWFTNGGVNSQTFNTYAQNIITGFKNKMGSRYTDTRSSMTAWATSVKNWFTKSGYGSINYYTFRNYAENVITGFNNGINTFYTNTRSAMERWAEDLKKTFTKRLDERSPSKEFFKYAVFAIKGFNNGIVKFGISTKPIMEEWAKSILSDAPQIKLGVDTSALQYYKGEHFSKNISANVTSSSNITVIGFKEAMNEFYKECIESTLSQMAENIRRQADKNEQTIVQVGSRTITDAVVTQQKANGFNFVTP